MDTVESICIGDVVITELWHYSLHIQCIFTTQQCTLFSYPGDPPTSLWYYRRVSALGQAAWSPWWPALNRKKCTQFFLERLVFMGQHTGVAISPKSTFLSRIVCLKNHEFYMFPFYFRFKLCTHCLTFIDFAEIPLTHLWIKWYILSITKSGYLLVKPCSTNSLYREFSFSLRDFDFCSASHPRGFYFLGSLTQRAGDEVTDPTQLCFVFP